MSQPEEQFGANGSSSVSETQLRLYLLGRLNDDERTGIEQRLWTDEAFADRVQLAESQLIDDYVTGGLDDAEREGFTKSFLTTEARQQKLRVATALRGYAASRTELVEAPTAKPSWREGLAGLFTFRPTAAWATAGSFAVLAFLLVMAWFLSKQQHRNDRLAANQTPVPAFSPQVPTPQPDTAQMPKPTEMTEVTPTPPEPTVPVVVANAVLLPGALRAGGEMTRVAVPGGVRDLVRISLVLENPEPAVYQAEVTTAEGQSVAVRSNLKPRANGHAKVTFELPARLLQSGDYQVKLSRKADGQTEPVGRYYFRALSE